MCNSSIIIPISSSYDSSIPQYLPQPTAPGNTTVDGCLCVFFLMILLNLNFSPMFDFLLDHSELYFKSNSTFVSYFTLPLPEVFRLFCVY